MNDLTTLTTNCSYNPEAKKAFHRVAAKYLKRLRPELSMYGSAAPLRHNQGGIAVSGEITLHFELLYVQVAQMSFGRDTIVMFRECKSLKDYTGGQNHFADARLLMDTAQFVRVIQTKCRFPMKMGEPL